jgi:hypothetical protein
MSGNELEQYKRKGFLLKEGALFTLKKRYFVLSPHEFKLYYAKDANTAAALGAVDLAGASVDVYTTTNKSRRFAFRIRGGVGAAPLATLVAPDAVMRDDWMMALSAVIHAASVARLASTSISASSQSSSPRHSSSTMAYNTTFEDDDDNDDVNDANDANDDDDNVSAVSETSADQRPSARRRRSLESNSARSAKSATTKARTQVAGITAARARPRPQSVSYSSAQLSAALAQSRDLASAASSSTSVTTVTAGSRASFTLVERRSHSSVEFGTTDDYDHDMQSADEDGTATTTTTASSPNKSRASSKSGGSKSKSKPKATTLRSLTVSAADHADGMSDVLTPRVADTKRRQSASPPPHSHSPTQSHSSSPAFLLSIPAPTHQAPATPAPKPPPPAASLSLSAIETPRPAGVAPAPPVGNRRRALTAVNGEPAPDPSVAAHKPSGGSTMDPRSLRVALAKKELLEEIAEERAAAAAGASASPAAPASPSPASRALSPSPQPLSVPGTSSSPARNSLDSSSARKVLSSSGVGVVHAGSSGIGNTINTARGLRNSPIPIANAQEELVLTPQEKARREKGLEIQMRMFQAVVSESKGRKLLTDEGKVIFDPNDDDSQQSPAPPRRAAPRTGERRRSSSFSAHQTTTSWPSMNLEDSPRAPVEPKSPAPANTMTIDDAASSDTSDDSEVDFTAPTKPSPAAIAISSGVAAPGESDGDESEDDEDDAPLAPPTQAPLDDSPPLAQPVVMKKPPPPSTPVHVPKPPSTPPMAPRSASNDGGAVPPPLPATPEMPHRSLSTSGKVSSLVAKFGNPVRRTSATLSSNLSAAPPLPPGNEATQ